VNSEQWKVNNKEDKKEETTTHPEPVSKPKKVKGNKPEQAEQTEYKETTEQIETSFDKMKELVEQTDKLENNFENKLNVLALWTKLIARYYLKRLETFAYVDTLEPQLAKNTRNYAEYISNFSNNIIKEYQNLKKNKLILTQENFEKYKQDLLSLETEIKEKVNSIQNIYKIWYYEMFWKKHKIKAPRIQVYDFKYALENILNKENPSIKDIIVSFRKLDKTIPGERVELSGDIKDLSIQYLEKYDNKFQQISEIKLLENPFDFPKSIEKLNPQLQDEIQKLIEKYKQQVFDKLENKDNKTTIPFDETEIYLNPNFQNELKSVVVKYLIENNKLNNVENQDLLKILNDIYGKWWLDLADNTINSADNTINSAHNVKDFMIEQVSLLLPALKITKFSVAKLLAEWDTQLVNKIRLYLGKENKSIVDYVWKWFVQWNLETPIFTASYEWLSSIMNQENTFTLENIAKDYELIVLLHMLDKIKISFTDKLWKTKYVSLLNYVEKQSQIVKYILNTGVDVAMLAQSEKVVKFTFTGEYKLTDEELATIISMVIIVNKLTKTDEVKIVKENDKLFTVIEKDNRKIKIPIETRKSENKEEQNKKDKTNIYKAKWWESTIAERTWKIDLEILIKNWDLAKNKEQIKQNLETEIKEEFRNLLKNVKSLKSIEELDGQINKKISEVLKRYESLWIIKDIKTQQKRLVKQFNEALYKRFWWEKLKSDLLNRYFWKMVEEIRNNKTLSYEIDKYLSLREYKREKDNTIRKMLENLF